MKNLIAKIAVITLLIFSQGHYVTAQTGIASQQTKSKMTSAIAADREKTSEKDSAVIAPQTEPVNENAADSSASLTPEDSLDFAMAEEPDPTMIPVENSGFHRSLKVKFIEGNAVFMSFVALALVLGLSFCMERIIYLTLSEIDAKKLMSDLETLIMSGDIEEAVTTCKNTRGPVASICYQGITRIEEPIEDIERGITSYGIVQAANLEKGCSWITMFIAMAPSLGFLGTVIGMMMSFEQIQLAGDISPTIVAAGMKVALITTIFGIIAALVLQIFYNYILSKIEHITSQMEESAITLLDIIMKYKLTR